MFRLSLSALRARSEEIALRNKPGLLVNFWLVLIALSGCSDRAVLLMASPAGDNTSGPNVRVTIKGQPILSWQRKIDDITILEYSVLSNGAWSEPIEIARGKDWFVNWADIPAVQPVTEDFWAAHYLKRTQGGKYAYDVQLRLSNDGGNNWRDAGSPHKDGTLTEHGFVSMYAYAENLGVIWLDGREMSSQADFEKHHGSHGGMTLRSVSMDSGGRFSNRRIVDSLVCDCCQTAAVITRDSPLVVYRDRTQSERRDIASSRWGQDAWTPPKPVSVDGWHIDGCPVNGPALVAQENDVVATWFSGAGGKAQIFFVRSSNGGKSFEERIRVGEGPVLGRVSALMYPDRSLFITWVREDADGKAMIVGRHITSKNEFSEVVNLADVSPTRASGFPKLLLSGSDTVLAWTDQLGSSARVKTLLINIESFR